MSNFNKIRPVGAEEFHAERWTNTTKLIVAFRKIAKAPKYYKQFAKSSLLSRDYFSKLLEHVHVNYVEQRQGPERINLA